MEAENKNLIALADSFMAIFGFKRVAIVKDNVVKPTKWERSNDQ